MIDELRLGEFEKKCVPPPIKKVEETEAAADLFEMIDCPTSPL